MLEPTDKACSNIGEDSMGYFKLAKGMVHTGGVLAATRLQGHDGNWRSPVAPGRNPWGEVGPITEDTGKGPKEKLCPIPCPGLDRGNHRPHP